ncbi:hypothetical protein KC330_g3390 [Hortaea werneckii]|nr:hypothetical protein KC330_g3390 [Hortaea werneckii]
MHFFYCFFTLTGLLASANAIRPRFYDGLQQVIGKETMTVTETITSTLYQTVTESATSVTAGPPLQHFRATITLTHTHTATASPTAERVVQTWRRACLFPMRHFAVLRVWRVYTSKYAIRQQPENV